MHNSTTYFLTQVCLTKPWEPFSTTFLHLLHDTTFLHGDFVVEALQTWRRDVGHMIFFSLHGSTSLWFLLLPLFFFSSFILPKLLWSLHLKAIHTKRVDKDNEICTETKNNIGQFYVGDDYGLGNDDLVAEVSFDGAALFFFIQENDGQQEDNTRSCLYTNVAPDTRDSADVGYISDHVSESAPAANDSGDLGDDDEEVEMESVEVPVSCDTPTPLDHFHTPNASVNDSDSNHDDGDGDDDSDHERSVDVETNEAKEDVKKDSSEEDVFMVVRKFAYESNKVQQVEHAFPDNSTIGSTSKSSCEWRSSTNFRDSETDGGLFSSSSRRSSSNWESYALYRKYDEDMMFFDRISTQKLRETESLRSINYQPRSISERIVHKFTSKNNKPSHYKRWSSNPYQELEAAYVAQICLAWEALNWNYRNFQRLTSEQNKEDPGCPARVAQKFQQFQVLLRRFIENEPYEYGRRPEVYARMRILSPNLLQVPEFQGWEAEEAKDDMVNSSISSAEFLKILGYVIRTFMDFLNGDKEKHCCLQVFRALLKKKQSSVDPTMLSLMRKTNNKKKARLKDLQKSKNCLRKRKLNDQYEMEILMGLIDMKIVARVLRMPCINEEQLHWCEEKMSKVKFWNGKVQRDSSPLFFPSQ